MSTMNADVYSDRLEKARNHLSEAIKLRSVIKDNLPIMMDDDGTRFPMQFPEIQLTGNSKESIYKQQIDAVCEGLVNMCVVASYPLDTESLKMLEPVFELYKSNYIIETSTFLHECVNEYRDNGVPIGISRLYELARIEEDTLISTGKYKELRTESLQGFSDEGIYQYYIKRSAKAVSRV